MKIEWVELIKSTTNLSKHICICMWTVWPQNVKYNSSDDTICCRRTDSFSSLVLPSKFALCPRLLLVICVIQSVELLKFVNLKSLSGCVAWFSMCSQDTMLPMTSNNSIKRKSMKLINLSTNGISQYCMLSFDSNCLGRRKSQAGRRKKTHHWIEKSDGLFRTFTYL